MSESASDVIEREFTSAIDELFEHYAGAKPVIVWYPRDLRDAQYEGKDQSEDAADTVTSSVGLNHREFRSAVAVMTDIDSIVALGGGEARCPVDWLGEFANQLAGRLKNKLSGYSVIPQMSLPVSVRGARMAFRSRLGKERFIRVETEGCMALIKLHVEIEPTIQWELDPNLASADEGSLCLF